MSEGNEPTAVTAADIAALSAYIFDLDGVIWRGGEPVEGAVEAVQRLRAAGKKILYCTNNSSREPREYAERLRGMGLELDDDDVLTSSWATAVYLSAQFTGPFSVFVVGEEGLVNALQKTGARIVHEHDVDDDTRVDCVVVGIDRSFNYDRLCLAQQLILRGAEFVATNRDTTFPMEDGKVIPGSGAIVAAVEAASGVTPVTIGKPRPAIVQLALQRFDLKAEETAMVGDRLDTDIAAARNAGILALFVATGVNTPEQARKSKGLQRPHALFPNLTALCQIALNDSTITAPAPAPTETPTEVVAEETTVAETVDGVPASDESAQDESTPDVAGSFSFAESDLTPDATEISTSSESMPSTAAEEASGQIADDMAAAPEPPELPPAETAPVEQTLEETAKEGESVDLSELEGIEWGAEAETPANDELAKEAEATPTPVKAEANPDDPFGSWFEEAEEKKS